MYWISRATFRQIRALAENSLPVEASGILLAAGQELKVLEVSSRFNTPVTFLIARSDIERVSIAVEGGPWRICGCFHSHTVKAANPSIADANGARDFGGLWLIYSVRFREIRLYFWQGNTFHRRKLKIRLRSPVSSSDLDLTPVVLAN